MKRACKTCGVEKMPAEYPEPGRRICKTCKNTSARRRYKDKRGALANSRWSAVRFTPEQAAARQLASQRRSKLRLKYGMTVEQYDALAIKQGGACAICRKPKPLHVDHCHKTGMVRGLLCNGCNVGIGHLGDDPQTVEAAAAYLRSSRPKSSPRFSTRKRK